KMHRIWTPSGGLADTRRVDVAVVERGLERWEAIGPSSVAWKVNREVVLLLGWTPAILMQFAHPLVAAGVADHSDFASDGRARVARLRSTLGAMLRLTFGTPAEVL